MDKIAAMPKWQSITIAVVLIGGLGFAVVYYGFGLNKKEKVEEGYTGSVMLEMSDPDSEEYNKSRYQSYQESDYSTTSSGVSSYWDSLLGEEKPDESDVYLDPNIYSPSEILFIQQGIRTKEDIDREHAERALAEATKVTPPPAPVKKALTPEQQDSIYFARLEKAYGIAAKYSGQAEPEPEKEPEPEVRKIDLTGDASKTPEASFLPTDSFTDDGIISSLDTPSQNGLIHYVPQDREDYVRSACHHPSDARPDAFRRDDHPSKYPYHGYLYYRSSHDDQYQYASLWRKDVPYGHQCL